MTRNTALAGVAALAFACSGVSADGQRRVDLEAADCSTMFHMSGDFEVARATQHTSIPVTAGTLELRPGGNNGARIERGAGGVYHVTACIAAGARTHAEAQAAVDGVRLEVEGPRVRVRDGGQPDGVHSFRVQLIVTAPDGATIDAETSNGPLGAQDFTGTLDLRASNGPISLRGVSGQVKARASNGPVSVAESRGEVDVETSNGPIDVRLDGQRWDGHLTARADNGPLTVTVPAGFQSGVEVRSSSHSPWNCRAAACANRSGGDWDERARMLRIGGDPVVVKLSTLNGPVTVRER